MPLKQLEFSLSEEDNQPLTIPEQHIKLITWSFEPDFFVRRTTSAWTKSAEISIANCTRRNPTVRRFHPHCERGTTHHYDGTTILGLQGLEAKYLTKDCLPLQTTRTYNLGCKIHKTAAIFLWLARDTPSVLATAVQPTIPKDATGSIRIQLQFPLVGPRKPLRRQLRSSLFILQENRYPSKQEAIILRTYQE